MKENQTKPDKTQRLYLGRILFAFLGLFWDFAVSKLMLRHFALNWNDKTSNL